LPEEDTETLVDGGFGLAAWRFSGEGWVDGRE
jgi:hypothetical protein